MLFTGNALWTPTQLTSAVWLDAADAGTITLNGSNVSQWNDKSGNNRHATQTTPTLQPSFVSNASNGLPALQTDGGDNLIIGNRLNLFQDVGSATIAIMVKYVAGTYSGGALSVFVSNGISTTGTRFSLTPAIGTSIGFTCRRTDSDTAINATSSTSRTNTGVVNLAAIQIGNVVYSSAQGNHFTNGTQDLTNSALAFTNTTPTVSSNTTPLNASLFSINNNLNVPTLALPSGCQLFEVLMFNSTLSTTDRQRLEGYLAWKWGSVATLPAGHPFKNSPPYL